MTRPTYLLLTLTLVCIGAWCCLDDPDPVYAGEPGWTAVPKEVGQISGRVVADDDVPLRRLKLDLHFEAARTTDMEVNFPLAVDDAGFFTTPELPPGVATLEVRAGGTRVALVEGLLVEDGVILQPEIDVRGRVHLFEFQLEDIEGMAVANAVVGWRPAAPEDGGPPYQEWITVRGGRCVVLDGAPLIDVLVQPSDAGVVEHLGLSHGHVLTVPTSWFARVAPPADIDPDGDDTRLELTLSPSRLDPRVARAKSAGGQCYAHLDPITVPADGTWLELPHAGPWRAQWIVWHDGRRLTLDGAASTFELALGDGSETVEPAFPAEAYRGALSQAR